MRTLLGLALLLTACTPAVTSTPADDAPTFRVVDVIDGDTFTVGAGATRVRLIGVNTPEHDECYGPEAAAGLVDLIGDRTVRLATDVEQTDQYGRLLAYVYVDDVFVNEALAEQGYAIARPYPPNLALQPVLEAAMRRAQTERRGLWEACASPAVGSVEIVDVEADPPGPDGQHLDEETITVANRSDRPVDLTGWTVRDGSSVHRFVFGATVLGPGATLRIRSGCGRDRPGDLAWCAGGPVWDNQGDIAMILDSAGHIVDVFAYSHR